MSAKQHPKQDLPAVDYGIFFIAILLSAFSCLLLVMLYLSGEIQVRAVVMQVMALVLGFGLAIGLSNVHYHLMVKLIPFLVVTGVALVLLLKVPGLAYMPEGSDDLAWIRVGYFSMQPSETLKIIFIYTFSIHLAAVWEKINRFWVFLTLCLHGAIPTFLVVDTGDLGSALVVFLIFAWMLYAAGISRKLLALGVLCLAFAAPVVWHFLPDYLQTRFKIAWRPELDSLGAGFQQYRGIMALQRGGWTGIGSAKEAYVSVPECYNDFVFSYIGQRFGYVCCAAVIVLLTILLIWILSVAAQAKDPLRRSLCIGVFAMIFSQTVINLGMVLCLIPVVGITLPFVSAGGTSMCVCFAGIGMVMSVHRFQPIPVRRNVRR